MPSPERVLVLDGGRMGADGPTRQVLADAALMEAHGPDTTVYPGHMGITTLGHERATNPFLRELAAN